MIFFIILVSAVFLAIVLPIAYKDIRYGVCSCWDDRPYYKCIYHGFDDTDE